MPPSSSLNSTELRSIADDGWTFRLSAIGGRMFFLPSDFLAGRHCKVAATALAGRLFSPLFQHAGLLLRTRLLIVAAASA